MEEQKCPVCGKTRVVAEKRRVNHGGNTTIGAWRIPYSLVAGVIVLAVGILCLVAMRTAADPFLVELAVIGAVVSFVFAAFVLGSVVYFARWDEKDFFRCQACDALWQKNDPSARVQRPSRPVAN